MYAQTKPRTDGARKTRVGSNAVAALTTRSTRTAQYGTPELAAFAGANDTDVSQSMARLTDFRYPTVVGVEESMSAPSLSNEVPGARVRSFIEDLARDSWGALPFAAIRSEDSLEIQSKAYLASRNAFDELARRDVPEFFDALTHLLLVTTGKSMAPFRTQERITRRARVRIRKAFGYKPLRLPPALSVDVLRQGPQVTHRVFKETLRGAIYGTACRFAGSLLNAHHLQFVGWLDADDGGMVKAHTYFTRLQFERNGNRVEFDHVDRRGTHATVRETTRRTFDRGVVIQQRAQLTQELINARSEHLDASMIAVPARVRRFCQRIPKSLRPYLHVWDGTLIQHSIAARDEQTHEWERLKSVTTTKKVTEWHPPVRKERFVFDPILELAGFALVGWHDVDVSLRSKCAAKCRRAWQALLDSGRQSLVRVPAATKNSAERLARLSNALRK